MNGGDGSEDAAITWNQPMQTEKNTYKSFQFSKRWDAALILLYCKKG